MALSQRLQAVLPSQEIIAGFSSSIITRKNIPENGPENGGAKAIMIRTTATPARTVKMTRLEVKLGRYPASRL
ncbi:MAG TPA: hypothetical protein VN900_04690 [Stellaceae bacterium]|nr:hypothetical protein [Stellaceae bacterium]